MPTTKVVTGQWDADYTETADQIQEFMNSQVYNEFVNIYEGAGETGSVNQSVFLSHLIWTELLNSYIEAHADSDLQEKIDVNKSAVSTHASLIDEAYNDTLLSANNQKGLAKILRYSGKKLTIMPFEMTGLAFETADPDLAASSTGVDQWVDPNIGNAFEGNDTDFSEMDVWLEEFSDFVNKSRSISNAYVIDGHGQLIFNEIARLLQQQVEDFPLFHPDPNILEYAESSDTGWYFENTQEVGNHMFDTDQAPYTASGTEITSSTIDMSGINKIAAILHIFKRCSYQENEELFWHLVLGTVNNITGDEGNTLGVWFQSFMYDYMGDDVISAYKYDYDYSEARNKARALVLSAAASFITRLEKAICWDVATNAAASGLAPAPGAEETSAEQCWKDIFKLHSGTTAGHAYPISGGDLVSFGSDLQLKTTFSGKNHIVIRALLVTLISKMASDLMPRYNRMTYGDEDESMYIRVGVGAAQAIDQEGYAIRSATAKLFMGVVNNIDEDAGPVRWKMTYGPWPNDDIGAGLSENAYSAIIPSFARDIRCLAAGVSCRGIVFRGDGLP